jgi:hypothetical protein
VSPTDFTSETVMCTAELAGVPLSSDNDHSAFSHSAYCAKLIEDQESVPN